MSSRNTWFMAAFCLLLLGCSGSKPATVRYALDYDVPAASSDRRAADVLRVDRFTVAPDQQGRDLLSRSEASNRVKTLRGGKWAALPEEMIVSLLSRDIRQAGLFRAVLTSGDAGEARWLLNGRLDAFIRQDRGGVQQAQVVLTATLVDTRNAGICFQKTYIVSEPCTSGEADVYARAMSLALQRLSRELLTDLKRGIDSVAS